MNSRHDIRRAMRAQRRGLRASVRHAAATSVARHLAASSLFARSQRIAVYLANDGELDLQPVVRRIWSLRKRCYLPVLDNLTSNRLWFAPYQPGDSLVTNQFGIAEPDVPARAMSRAWNLDLVLVPLVAFDRLGNRIGMGGGYYDRSLAYLLGRRCWRKPRLLGVAYAFQRTDRIESEPWDVPLDGVATEQGIRWYTRR